MDQLEAEVDAGLAEVRHALEREGIRLRLRGADAIIQIDDEALACRWVWWRDRGRSGAQSFGVASELERVLLLGDRIPAAVAERARARGDWYADAQGNAYIRAPGVRIDIRGRRPATPIGLNARPRSVRETNLMSGRRAQVVFTLLSWPELLEAPIRYLADAAGVSVSSAHSARMALQEERYILPGVRRIDRWDELLNRWADAFPLGMARTLELGRFVGEPDPIAWLDAEHAVCVSGENAISRLRGPSLTMYVSELDKRAVVQSRWRRTSSEGEPANIILRRKFWKAPWGKEDVIHPHAGPRVSVAPPLLVYADLLASRDPRQREVAHDMRRDLLEPPTR